MKKTIAMLLLAVVMLGTAVGISACKSKGQACKDIQLMGAGDRIHDTYTFANTGVKLIDDGNNTYTISGSVDYLADKAVKEEFDIDQDVNHVVAIKLSNCGTDKVVKKEVEISVDGVRNYDAEHLNGSDYTFIILEAVAGQISTISVKWNKDAKVKTYTIKFSDQLQLGQQQQ